MNAVVPIRAAGFADRGPVRFFAEVPAGLTVEEIVKAALPRATAEELRLVRVVLAHNGQRAAISQEQWHVVRPNAGVTVLVTIVPGKDALRVVLQLLVAFASIAIGNYIAGTGLFISLFGEGTFLAGVVKSGLGLALNFAGGLLINALLPISRESNEEKPTFAIGGFRNRLTPDAPFPMLLGEMRYAGPLGMYHWTEVVGDILYTRCNIVWGLGEHVIENLKLGDTLLTKYDEFQEETYTGLASDPPFTLTNYQVVEIPIGTDLIRNLPRDDTGTKLNQPHEPSPVVRNSALDTSEVRLIFSAPLGLMWVNDDGDEAGTIVRLQIRYRQFGEGDDDWSDPEIYQLIGLYRDTIYRQHTITLPERGEWEIEVENLTGEIFDTHGGSMINRVTWTAIQSVRPEYPFNADFPLAQTALRIKATAQINGQLDNLNADLKRVCLDWDQGTGTWIKRATRNPASLARYLLQAPWSVRPVSNGNLDLDAFQAWHEFCEDKGLHYDRQHDFAGWTDDALKAVGAAGRAVIREDGLKWTVNIDRPDEIIVDHINARNSSGLKWAAEYSEFPDAVRVQFLDRTRKYQPGERIIPWPADIRFANLAAMNADLDWSEGSRAEDISTGLYYRKSGAEGAGSWVYKPIEITEQMELPGKTDPDEIWIEARRRMYEIKYRSVSYTATQRGLSRITRRGSKVMIAKDVLLRSMHSARVKAVRDNHVEIDDVWTMEAGKLYDIRFRTFPDDNDPVGVSQTRAVMTIPGETRAVVLTGTGEKPPVGQVIHFGPRNADGIPAIVTRIERGRDNASIITMLPSAEIIDELTDAEVPPAWDGRVGSVLSVANTLEDDEGFYLTDDEGFRLIDEILPKPSPPVFASITTGGFDPDDELDPSDVVVLLRPASGSDPVVGYQLDHRLVGAPGWTTVAGNTGGIVLTSYDFGDEVEFGARAVSANGEVSETKLTTELFKVGQDTEFMPPLESFDAIRQTNGLWRYVWVVGELEGWQTPLTVAGAKIRYKLGAWGSWDDLDPAHTNLITVSPWDSSIPEAAGVYTFGIVLVGEHGEETEPYLIHSITTGTNALFTDDEGHPLMDDAADYLIED